MTSPKTLFLVPSLARAGAEKQVVDLVNGLAGRGVPCHLASFDDNRDQLAWVNKDLVPYHALNRSGKVNWGLVRRIAAIVDGQGMDILHCTLSIAILHGFLARLISHRKPALVVGVHTTLSRTLKDEFLERWLYRWILRSSARVVFVCHRQQEYWLSRDPRLARNSIVIYNGVDPAFYSRALAREDAARLRSGLGIPSDAPVFCCIAAFRPEKSQGNIIRSMASLSGRFPTAHAIFAGDGNARPRIETLVQKSKLEDRVHFLGNIPDVRPVLAAASFSIIASTAVETFSFAMLESMSMETPVLSTRIGGADEAVIPGVTGYLAEPGDIGSLQEGMARLLEDAGHTAELGINSRRKVEQVFSAEEMITRTERLLAELV